MKSRRIAREVALQFLYRHDVASVAKAGKASPSEQPDHSPDSDLEHHFEHFGVPPELQGFASLLVLGTLRERETLDALLEKHASNWKVARMGFIDRNLLRMAVFELKNCADIPPIVTIHEAVELAKQFGTAETAPFVNGILDAIKGEVFALREQENTSEETNDKKPPSTEN